MGLGVGLGLGLGLGLGSAKPNPNPSPNPDQVLGTEKGERLAANRFLSTHQVVDNAIGRRRQELCVPF